MEELPKLNELKQELSDALERSCWPYGLDESDQMADAWDDMVNATYEVTQLAIDKAVTAAEQKLVETLVADLRGKLTPGAAMQVSKALAGVYITFDTAALQLKKDENK